ncbi:helix-turn-helix domain-containing protein [Nocardiopsis trehalosi]|jgi:DNA-binding NarL/FixJ family response regulator|uniref:helix-turn-helix domain-containing protein n=1 Tax=Nocardiopsis trehalosi TaxID=109329 RepID=UPI000831F3F6|nr:helix-turn-helix transcriptional regulator [Nocardiopsis trehalosi]
MPPSAAEGDLADIRAGLPLLRRHGGLPVVFGGAVGADGAVRYTELAGVRTDAIRDLRVAPGRGLGGRSLAVQRPAWVRDYVSATAISHHYDAEVAAEGLRAMVAVPVVVRGRTRGVLLGALRASVALGDRAVAAAAAAARTVEQHIVVRDEAQDRLAALERARAAGGGAGPAAAAARWEEIRALNAELRAIAGAADGDLQERLLRVCARMAWAAGPQEARSGAPSLPPRELDVLACVALGHTNADVAAHLGVRPETVKGYLRSAMRRLGAHTRLEAVTAARRWGLLP